MRGLSCFESQDSWALLQSSVRCGVHQQQSQCHSLANEINYSSNSSSRTNSEPLNGARSLARAAQARSGPCIIDCCSCRRAAATSRVSVPFRYTHSHSLTHSFNHTGPLERIEELRRVRGRTMGEGAREPSELGVCVTSGGKGRLSERDSKQ